MMLRKVIVTLALVWGGGAWAANLNHTGEVIVKFRPNVFRTLSAMQDLYSRQGVEDVRYLTENMPEFEVWQLQPGRSVEKTVRDLARRSDVEFAQPNYLLVAPEVVSPLQGQDPPPGFLPIPCIPGFEIPGCDPNASLPCLIPGLPFPPGCSDRDGPPAERPELAPAPSEPNPPASDPDLANAWGLGKIKSPEAWRVQPGNKSIVVAVIDTGIDYNHEDLAFNVWRNPNPTNNDVAGYDFIHNDGLPFDDQGHGTHTAGSVGAVGMNGKAISGVAQRVSIMGLKFISSSGQGTTEGAIKAIDYAVEKGAKILSNSWGGPSGPGNQALSDAIERARQKGVLFVVAAGNESADNDGSRASFPAAFPHDNIISVAATTSADGMASFSNFGKTSVDLGAPGQDVYSLMPGNSYASHSGTSMACPHVSGAAAVVWAQNPTWTYKQVAEALMKSVDPLPALRGKTVTGGRLNVAKALSYRPAQRRFAP